MDDKIAEISLTRRFHFDACHHLPNYQGPCARLHGHTYYLEVTVTGPLDAHGSGMIMDFKELDRIVKEKILSIVDHEDLNEIYPNPTAELMISDFWKRLDEAGLAVKKLRLWETEGSYATLDVK